MDWKQKYAQDNYFKSLIKKTFQKRTFSKKSKGNLKPKISRNKYLLKIQTRNDQKLLLKNR